MLVSNRTQDVRLWRQETLQELERAAAALEKIEREVSRGRERLQLLDRLLELEGEPARPAAPLPAAGSSNPEE